MKRYEVTEEDVARCVGISKDGHAVVVDTSKLKEIPEGAVYLTREQVEDAWFKCAFAWPDGTPDGREDMLNELFGKEE